MQKLVFLLCWFIPRLLLAQSPPAFVALLDAGEARLYDDQLLFDIRENGLIFLKNEQLRYFKLLNDSSIEKEINLGKLTLEREELVIDLALVSPLRFGLLTNKRYVEFEMDLAAGKVKDKALAQVVFNKEVYSLIHKQTESGAAYLSVNFTSLPEKLPKIQIRNLHTGAVFKQFVNCDPFSIYPKTKLISFNGKQQFLLQPDNLKGEFLLLDSGLNERGRFFLLDTFLFDAAVTRDACGYYNKYRAFGLQTDYDSMSAIISRIPYIDQIDFINDTTVLICGYRYTNDKIKPFCSLIGFDKAFTNIISRGELRLSFRGELLQQPFSKFAMPFNPLAKRLKTDSGKYYYLDWIVDTTEVKTNSDYQTARHKLTSKRKVGIYVYR